MCNLKSSDEKIKSLADKISVLYDMSLHDMKYFMKMVYIEHFLSYDILFACYHIRIFEVTLLYNQRRRLYKFSST